MGDDVAYYIEKEFFKWVEEKEEERRIAQQHRWTKTNGPAQQAGPNAFKQTVETPEGVQSTLQASGSGVSVNGNGDVTGGTITSYAIIFDANNKFEVSGFAPISAVDFYNNTKESVSTEARYNFLVSLSDGDTTGTGSDGFDGFEVGAGNDTVISGDGDDAVIKFKSGNLTFNGGDDSDSLIFVPVFGADPSQAQNLVVDLAAGTGANPYGGTLTLVSVENIVGTSGDDTITGNDSDNFLDGHRGGDDTISGGVGDDKILVAVGSGGAQQHLNLDGGGDTDKLVYDIASAATVDNVLDLTTPSNKSGAFQFVTVANFEVYRVGDLTGAPGTRKVDFSWHRQRRDGDHG